MRPGQVCKPVATSKGVRTNFVVDERAGKPSTVIHSISGKTEDSLMGKLHLK
jgi:hypothetical protein